MALTMPTSLWLGGEFETAVRDYAAKRPRGEPSQVKGLPVAAFLALGLLFILRSAPFTAGPPAGTPPTETSFQLHLLPPSPPKTPGTASTSP